MGNNNFFSENNVLLLFNTKKCNMNLLLFCVDTTTASKTASIDSTIKLGLKGKYINPTFYILGGSNL